MNIKRVPYLGLLGLIALLGVICEAAADGRNNVAESCGRYLRLADNTRTALASESLMVSPDAIIVPSERKSMRPAKKVIIPTRISAMSFRTSRRK